ncbi:hypothetical protein J2747_002229 [Thermococcus stetteri]|nr:hypothetical protein [Thermococcus stetteri]
MVLDIPLRPDVAEEGSFEVVPEDENGREKELADAWGF